MSCQVFFVSMFVFMLIQWQSQFVHVVLGNLKHAKYDTHSPPLIKWVLIGLQTTVFHLQDYSFYYSKPVKYYIYDYYYYYYYY